MTPYQVEIARHPDGAVLFVRPANLKPPWLALKLMLPKGCGRVRRVWLCWNTDKRQLTDSKHRARLAEELPALHDWVLDVLEAVPTEILTNKEAVDDYRGGPVS